MLLGEILVDILKKYGINIIHIDRLTLYKVRDFNSNIFQALAILLLNGRINICIDEERSGSTIYEYDNIKIIHGSGSEISKYYIRWSSRKCINNITDKIREEISNMLNIKFKYRSLPHFVIDLSFWDEHTENEKRELIEQIIMCIKTLRKYLYDSYLTLTSCSEDFIQYFKSKTSGMVHRVNILKINLREFIRRNIKNFNIVMLDPEGEFTLTKCDIFSYNMYILGGIIDKERVDKFGTYRLYSQYRLWEYNIPRMKICIDCSIIGVPDRLNRIIDIILKVRFEDVNIEDAIILNQTRRDRIYRWYFEIQKYSKKVVKDGKVIKHLISRKLFERLCSRYPISSKDIDRIFKSLNVEIVDSL